MNNLWKKLFTKNTLQDEASLHSAGATTRHRNPFEKLVVPRNEHEITHEFANEWVAPFYMANLADDKPETINLFADKAKEVNDSILFELLGYFDWRPKMSGAIFAAIGNFSRLEDVIGKHLLKSEVCYAGHGYCLALASFSTKTSKEYLEQYLDYYLDQKDLWFDQASALSALYHFDSTAAERFMEKWETFTDNKPNWNIDKSRRSFEASMKTLKLIQEQAR